MKKNTDSDLESNESLDSVLFDIKNKIATITINRPAKRNALRIKEFDSLTKFIKMSDNDSNVHVIRIRSSGDQAFSAGLDLDMLGQMTTEEAPKLINRCDNLVRTIIKGKKPVINQVQGPAVAWGTILCLAADFIVAGDNPKTFFSLPEIDLGLFPATGALSLALHKIGFQYVKKFLMEPEKIYLDKAEQLGFVTKRCPIESLENTTLDFCQNLSNKPQGILISIKALLNNFYIGNLEYFFKKETKALELTMAGDLDNIEKFINDLWKP